jgi:hypothetical protein
MYTSVNTAENSTSFFTYDKTKLLNCWADYGFKYSNKMIGIKLIFPMMQQPLLGQGLLLLIQASLSNSDSPHSVGLICKSDQPDAKTSTWQHTNRTRDKHSCPRRGSKGAIRASVLPQFHALNHAVTGTGLRLNSCGLTLWHRNLAYKF